MERKVCLISETGSQREQHTYRQKQISPTDNQWARAFTGDFWRCMGTGEGAMCRTVESALTVILKIGHSVF